MQYFFCEIGGIRSDTLTSSKTKLLCKIKLQAHTIVYRFIKDLYILYHSISKLWQGNGKKPRVTGHTYPTKKKPLAIKKNFSLNKTKKWTPTLCQDLLQIHHTHCLSRLVLNLVPLVVLEHHRAVALAAVVTVLHHGHEDSGAALLACALATETVNLAVLVNLERWGVWSQNAWMDR